MRCMRTTVACAHLAIMLHKVREASTANEGVGGGEKRGNNIISLICKFFWQVWFQGGKQWGMKDSWSRFH